MRSPALLERYFTVVIVMLAATAAYFQASSITRFVGDGFAASDALLGTTSVAQLPGGRETSTHAMANAGAAIIDRNPFDSATGRLLPKLSESSALQKLDLSSTLSAPSCNGVRVSIIAESSDPSWSLAALQASGDTAPKLRRIGDEVEGRLVAYIGSNPAQNSPAVWMMSGGTLCQALLLAKQRAAMAEPESAAPPTALATPASSPVSGPTGLAIAGKVQRVNDREFNVDRAVVEEVLQNHFELLKAVRLLPERKDGNVVGIRLFGIRPGSLLGTLGIENGDRLESINGFDIASPEQALRAYARLRSVDNLSLQINRRGQPLSIDYRIR